MLLFLSPEKKRDLFYFKVRDKEGVANIYIYILLFVYGDKTTDNAHCALLLDVPNSGPHGVPVIFVGQETISGISSTDSSIVPLIITSIWAQDVVEPNHGWLGWRNPRAEML